MSDKQIERLENMIQELKLEIALLRQELSNRHTVVIQQSPVYIPVPVQPAIQPITPYYYCSTSGLNC